jgi:hypothetical protein
VSLSPGARVQSLTSSVFRPAGKKLGLRGGEKAGGWGGGQGGRRACDQVGVGVGVGVAPPVGVGDRKGGGGVFGRPRK